MSAASAFLARIADKRRQLDQLASELALLAGRFSLAQEVEPEAAGRMMQQLLQLSGEIRQELYETAQKVGAVLRPWQAPDALDAAVKMLAERLIKVTDQPRSRLRDLAGELRRGKVAHRRPGRQRELDQGRKAAVEQLEGLIDQEFPPAIPGPDQGEWLPWWWHQEGKKQEDVLSKLARSLPSLANWLNQLEPEWWQPGVPTLSPAAAAGPATKAAPPAKTPPVPQSRPAPVKALFLPVERSKPLVRPKSPALLRRGLPEADTDPISLVTAKELVSEYTPPPETGGPEKEPSPPDGGNGQDGTADLAPAARPAPKAPEPRTPPPELLAPLPPHPPALAEEMTSFASFRAGQWISPTGACEPAPWNRREAFLEQLEAAAVRGLTLQRFHHVYLVCRAAEQLGATHLPRPADVKVLAALWAHPSDSSAGTDEERGVFVHGDPVSPTRRWRLALFLESLRPAHDCLPSLDEIDARIAGAGFESKSLRRVVSGLFHAAVMGVDPVPGLRETFRARTTDSLDVLRARLAHQRNELHATVKQLWKAAGGALQRTHCREVWDDFMEMVRPAAEPLYPPDRDGLADWDVDQVREQTGRLLRRYARMADERGVKYLDRSASDRAARRIIQAATTVNDTMEQIHRASGRRATAAEFALPVEPVRVLLQKDSLTDPLEECCRLTLVRLLEDSREADGQETVREPLEVTAHDLVRYPEWLALLEAGSLVDVERGRKPPYTLFHADEIRDPVQAAASLLGEDVTFPDHSDENPLDALLSRLRHHPRRDVLGGAVGQPLASNEQPPAQLAANARLEALHDHLALLHQKITHLDALGITAAPLRLAEIEAETLLRQPLDGVHTAELLGAWLKCLCRHATDLRQYERQVLCRRATEEPSEEVRARIYAALEMGEDARVVSLLSGNDEAESRPASFRETCWRYQVESRFGRPDAAARKLRQLPDDVAQAWKPVTGSVTQTDRALRTAFARLLFPEGNAGGNEGLYRKAENDAHHFAIATEHLRHHLAEGNPCFLPQLARFGRVVLLTPAVRVGDRLFKDRVRDQLTPYKKDLCLLLLPQLSWQNRREIQGWFRDLNAAVLDDYDLCRLLDSRGGRRPDPLVGTLEIAFEQLRWCDLSPFTADGWGTAETFVGRREEAEQLARGPALTRLFSGRKLGKSALLRFLREAHDGEHLPGGSRLRVVHVDLAGLEDEAGTAGTVLDALREQAGVPARGTPSDIPSARLVETLSGFAAEREGENLLILLDEADDFIEAQTRESRRAGARCLIARVRAAVTQKDAAGLLRVRILLAGFRLPPASEGIWGDGDGTLVLGPMPRPDAVRLLAGPLARLGIDAADEAVNAAYRCGWHPEVLTRFGEALLERLDQRQLPASRERTAVKVTAEDVSEVFCSERVQDEIWNVTRGNFQGNVAGFLVFAALLLEFAQRAPGASLEGAERLALERLRALDPEPVWLAREGGPADAVARHFHDLVERRLLVRTEEEGRVRHALRFPQHLPALTRRNLEREMQESIRELAENGGAEPARALLSACQINDLRTVLYQTEDLPVRAAVVASLWRAAAEDRRGGLAVWFGILNEAPEAVVSADSPDLHSRVGDRFLVVTGATPAAVEQVLGVRGPGLPPPVFSGGLDLLRHTLVESRRAEAPLIELACVARLTLGRLHSWFSRIRGYEFEPPDALAQILARTSGIPLFVEVIDRLLAVAARGKRVSATGLQEVFQRFEGERLAAADKLVGEDPGYRLTPREREILSVVGAVCRENGCAVRDLGAELTVNWELYQELCPLRAVDPSPGGEDAVSLELLTAVGLLPATSSGRNGRVLDRVAPLGADDALWLILERLGPPR